MASIVYARITFTDLVNAAFAGPNIGLPVDVGLAGVRTVMEKKHLAAITRLRDKLPKETRKQLNALLVLYQEHLSVLEDIINSDNPAEVWAAEARFQTQDDGTLKCKIDELLETMGDNFPLQSMLVVTQLTRTARRAYLKALHCGNTLFFNGPAGTGKTETAKDTSRMLGREPTIFNCSDQMTPDAVAAAIASVPKNIRAPLIFDEFNRIPTGVQKEILSRIQKERPGQFVILTANPGYPGRSPIAVPSLQTLKFTVPPRHPIAMAMLGAEGFVQCKTLAKSLIACLEACQKRCSKQKFYDYGLRQIKSLIRLAGAIARANGYTDEVGALRESIANTFYCRATLKDKAVVVTAIEQTFGASYNIPKKFTGPSGLAAQVLAMSQVRHGVCINGVVNPGEVIKAVSKLSDGADTVVISVDPKNDLTRAGGELYQHMKAPAGVKANIFLVLPPEGGPVPLAHIMESLNTLFDDNKKLTFDNGEILSMSNDLRFFVVTEDCSGFGPAHVSRLGIVSAF